MLRAVRALVLLSLIAAPLSAAGGSAPRLEIVSRFGRQQSLKIYSGESATFWARERREGLDGIFSPGELVPGVTFTLREWPPRKGGSGPIVNGVNRRVVVTKHPGRELWGRPPSTFTLTYVDAPRPVRYAQEPPDRAFRPSPGRYRLIAEKKGWGGDSILLHFAHLALTDIDADLGPEHYTASFVVRLVDPDEKGRDIPLLIETLDEEGRVVDRRRDVVLTPEKHECAGFRSSRRIRLSSQAIESFRDRYESRERRPLPPEFFDLKPLRITEGGGVRVAFRNLSAVYPLPLGT